jgi:predicted nucleic acid-binding protein
MTPIFADTFFFLAVINADDQRHRAAMDFSNSNKSPLLTTTWVLTEVLDGLARTPNRHLGRQLYLDLLSDPAHRVVPPSRRQFEQGLELYHTRPDKKWSLTDCISFLVMQEHGITEALTGDHHFAQAGFTPLLA